MIRRRRNVPWIQRWSRPIIGAIAIIGFILTAYLTITKLAGGEVSCSANTANPLAGCGGVLDSAYAYPLDPTGKTGPPLSLFGSLAYLAMAAFALTPLLVNADKQKDLRRNLENWTWWLLLAGSFAMAAFSTYLMYVLAFKLETVCYYCISSALFSVTLLILSIVGKEWDDIGQVFFTGVIVLLITFVTSIGIYANADAPIADINNVSAGEKILAPEASTAPKPPIGWEITTTSGEAEIALAKHLTSVGAVKYSAYWCPHCYKQKQLFGKEAFAEVTNIECAPDGENAKPQACTAAGIKSFPTWIIDDKIYEGTQKLEKLAEITNYTGPTNFKYR